MGQWDGVCMVERLKRRGGLFILQKWIINNNAEGKERVKVCFFLNHGIYQIYIYIYIYTSLYMHLISVDLSIYQYLFINIHRSICIYQYTPINIHLSIYIYQYAPINTHHYPSINIKYLSLLQKYMTLNQLFNHLCV